MRAALRADLFTGAAGNAVAPGANRTRREIRAQARGSTPLMRSGRVWSTFVYLIRIAARLMSNGTI